LNRDVPNYDYKMYTTILNTTGIYDDKETALFNTVIRERSIGKGGVLLEQGEVAKWMYFLISGAVYQGSQLYTQNNLSDLHLDNEGVLNRESLLSQRPSADQIIAFSDSIILEINLESIHYLISKSTAFLQMNTIIGNSYKSHFFLGTLTPLEKYQFILATKPDLIQKFPLKMIASYLKLAPETLSRVRKVIVQQRS